MIKVMKFGGTSVGSVDALNNVASIIQNEKAKKAVVVSAMSGVTNMLIACVKERSETEQFISGLKEKYCACAQKSMPESEYTKYGTELDKSLAKLSQAIDKRRAGPDLALDDMIASWGERLSSITLAAILRGHDIDALAMSSEEAGIVADGFPGNGSANLEATFNNLKRNVVPLIEAGRTVVLTGYYGCDHDGRPMTFGRGGSDYSGSVVAYAVNADCCEIWTDVNGFMTADPRAIQAARTIVEMDYGEAAELAYFGAKVLHPRTIEPVRKKNIPLLVKNTFNPGNKGTLIHCLRKNGNDLLRSVAAKGDLSIVKIYSSELVYQPGLISRLVSSISDAATSTYAVSTSLSTLAVVIPSSSVEEALRRINSLKESQIEKMTVKSNVSLICCVGNNMINTSGVAAKVFAVVADAGANIEMISEGASDVALNFVVPSDKAVDAIRNIHKTFIGG